MTTANFQHRPRRNWLQITISCNQDESEQIIHQLTTLTESGVQTETISGKEHIICYLEKDAAYPAKRQTLDTLLSTFTDQHHITAELANLEEENWAENWKSNYKPTKLSEHITVKPTWKDYDPQSGEIIIEIDPGMAFGTGLHFSTRLALRHIDTVFQTDSHPDTVLDIGTGTGILALACAKLGATNIIAIDNDPDAVVTALANIKQNNEQHRINCTITDLKDITHQVDLALANITADVLTFLQPDITPIIKPNGLLILAGILTSEQSPNIINVYQKSGLQLIDKNHEDEWTGLLFRQKA